MNSEPIWSNSVGTGVDIDKLKNKVTSVNGKTGDVELTAKDVGALSQDELQSGVNLALQQAKESGEFDGKDGNDYVLTEADIKKITEEAAATISNDLNTILATLSNGGVE